MKVKQVRVGYGATINIGNFQSIRIDVAAEAELGPTETIASAGAELYKQVRHEVRELARLHLEKKDATLTEIFSSLPDEVRQAIKE